MKIDVPSRAQRRGETFCRTFAFEHFHQSEQVFLALLRDEFRAMTQTALDHRARLLRTISRDENHE